MTRMRKCVSALSATIAGFALGSVLMAAGDAWAVNYWTSGQGCAPYVKAHTDVTTTGRYGVTSDSTTVDGHYFCPVTGYPSSVMDVAQAAVYYKDANSAVGLYCIFQACTDTTCTTSLPKHSCSSGVGCPSSDPAYVGDNVLWWFDPLGTSAVTGYSWSFDCTTPRKVGGNLSYVKSVGITL